MSRAASPWVGCWCIAFAQRMVVEWRRFSWYNTKCRNPRISLWDRFWKYPTGNFVSWFKFKIWEYNLSYESMLASRARILRKEKYIMQFRLLTATSLINDEKIPESSSTNMIDKIYRVVEKRETKNANVAIWFLSGAIWYIGKTAQSQLAQCPTFEWLRWAMIPWHPNSQTQDALW